MDIECHLGQLTRQLAKKIGEVTDLNRLKKLLVAIQQVTSGQSIDKVDEYPELDNIIDELNRNCTQCKLVFRENALGLFNLLAEVLLSVVAPDWLLCLSPAEKNHLYIQYFINGKPTQTLIFLLGKVKHSGEKNSPELQGQRIAREEAYGLLLSLFVEGQGISYLLDELLENNINEIKSKEYASLLASLPDRLPSIPGDKRHFDAKAFVEETFAKGLRKASQLMRNRVIETLESILTFLGTLFVKFCRRGFATSIAKVMRKMLSERKDVHSTLPLLYRELLRRIHDASAFERFTVSMLCIEGSDSSDAERTSTIFDICFAEVYFEPAFKAVVVEKIFLTKVIPLQWIKFLVGFISRNEECKDNPKSAKRNNVITISEVLYRCASIWGDVECPQLYSIGHQACLSLIILECLKRIPRDYLENEFPSIPLLLEGISLRLSSPTINVRNHGMSVARGLSLVLDSSRPLSFGDDHSYNRATLEDLALDTKDMLQFAKDQSEESTANSPGNQENKANITEMESLNLERNLRLDDVVTYGTNASEEESSSESEDTDSDDESLEAYDMTGDEINSDSIPRDIQSFIHNLRKCDEHETFEIALRNCERMIRLSDSSIYVFAKELMRALLYVDPPEEYMKKHASGVSPAESKLRSVVALIVKAPLESAEVLMFDFYSVHVSMGQRMVILDALVLAASEMSAFAEDQQFLQHEEVHSSSIDATPKERIGCQIRVFAPVSLSKKKRMINPQRNRFATVAHAFMLPILCKYDTTEHGLDMQGKDFMLLGKLLHSASSFVKYAGVSPQAVDLAITLLEFLDSTRVFSHSESFVRKYAIEALMQVISTIPPYLFRGDNTRESIVNLGRMDKMQGTMLSIAKYDADEQCRLLAAKCLQQYSGQSSAFLQA